jgi:polysaccharide export outer membrane protein
VLAVSNHKLPDNTVKIPKLFALLTALFVFSPLKRLPAQTPEDAARPKIHIGPGDLLELKIFDAPEFSQVIRVDDLGDTTIIFAGKIHLAGLTAEESQTLIAKKYQDRDIFLHPEVSVLIREYSTQGVSILGEVAKPGVFPVLGTLSLLDVISEAGGTTPTASNQVMIQRGLDGSMLTVNFSKNARDSFAANVEVHPGDKILVPRAGMVYVIGNVNRPGGFVMLNQGSMSLLQALAMAEGPTSTASLNRARLIRKTSSGYQDIPVPLKNMLNGHDEDRAMQADDILFIPNSAAKSVLYRGLPGILEAATSAAIYSAH